MLPFILFLIVVVTFWAWKHRVELKLAWQLPGVFPCIPFIGIAWRFFVQENLEAIESCLKAYDNIETPIGAWLGTKFLVFVDNARDIETVLTSPNCVRAEMYQYIKHTSGIDGLFTLEGEIARKHRRLVSPSFSEKVVSSYVTIFARLSLDLIENLKEMVNKEPFDIRRCVSDYTLDAFVEATCCVDLDKDIKSKLHRNMKLYERNRSAIVVPKHSKKRLLFSGQSLLWKLSGCSKLSQNLARDSMETLDKTIQKALDTGLSGVTFLDRMLRVSEKNEDFTMVDVKAEVITAFIAGSDTSAAAVAYTILLLAMHPEHQERVFEELKSILPSKDTPLCSEHIAKMTYLELCIKESLRLFPVVSLMSKVVKDGSINLGGYEVPAGVTIVIGVNRVHRKCMYWGADANKFEPTRFSPENIANVNRFAYIPFSSGSRNCLGYKYAYVAMKSVLASILRNYRLTTPLKLDELKVRMRVNIYLLNKHMVQIYERSD